MTGVQTCALPIYRRIGVLEGELLELNQRRQDAGKRIDELISQIEHLDARLGAAPGSTA